MMSKNLKAHTRTSTDSKIKVAENGKQAIFINHERKVFYIVRVDGSLLKNQVASDFVVSKEDVGDVVIELKGMDVDHAVEQVLATAQHWSENGYRNGAIAGLIVCSRKPSFDTKVQRFALKFAKQFKAPLHVVARNDEYVIEKVLSFSGPK